MGNRKTDKGSSGGNRLQRLWWLHDALWYQGVARRFGFKAANELNREVIKPVARRAMKAVLAGRGLPPKGALTAEEVLACFQEASELMWPAPMTRWEARLTGERTIEVTITKCYALAGLKRLGLAQAYECPCIDVREGWLEALGIRADQEILASMKDGAEACLIRVWLRS